MRSHAPVEYWEAEIGHDKDYLAGVLAYRPIPNAHPNPKPKPKPKPKPNLNPNPNPNHLAGVLAYHLGLTGPAEVVQTACSSSLVAVARAVHALRAGLCEIAICGGASFRLA